MRKLVIQTCDPKLYTPILRESEKSVKDFCAKSGFDYLQYIGIKRGSKPFHAMYNRIPMICELVDSGFKGWLLYVDADCYVQDIAFDVDAFLAERRDKVLIAATGGDGRRWAINDGVFFLDLASEEGRFLARDWQRRFVEQVTQEKLDDPTAGWDDAPTDQDLLHQVLFETEGIMERVDVLEKGILNYHGTFIAQALRAHHPTLDDRIAHIRRHNDLVAERCK